MDKMESEVNKQITSSLSGAVTNEIHEIYGKKKPANQDYAVPLEAPDFDPISFINQQFPSEESLDRLDPFIGQTAVSLADLDEEISKAVEAQSQAGQQAAGDIEDAKGAIIDLFDKIADIKEKAKQSEIMVQDICKDIKQLDYAKQHLQDTITALKRLHMLVTAVDQLKDRAAQRHYREAANLVDAVKQLLTHFESYSAVPKIAELKETYASIRKDLTEQIFKAFNKVGQIASNVADAESFELSNQVTPGEFRSLAEACLVVDALGPEARARQVKQYCGDQLMFYANIFRKEGDAASLDQVDRRFHWFKRLLRGVDERFEGVFPPHWHVPHRLTLEFLAQTKTHVLDILENTPSGQMDVKILVRALQRTLVFEREMRDRFESPETRAIAAREGEKSAASAVEADFDEDGNAVDPDSAEGIKRKYAREAAKDRQRLEDERKAREGGKSMFQSFAKEGAAEEREEVLPTIVGQLSRVYDPFMGPYIGLETKNLEEELMKVMQGEEVESSGKLPVFSSSVSIFGYMKSSLKRCTALTTGQTLLGLAKEFNRCLTEYANLLANKLPQPAKNPQGKETYKIADGAEQKICYVVNTAEYCAETLPQLAEMIRSRIDETYKDSISTEKEQEDFHEVVAHAMKVIVSGLESRFDPAYKSMSQVNWGTLEMVGEESEYVVIINDAISHYIPILKSSLSSLYFRSFCDKFAASFMNGYLNQILKLRRINEQGTQQLLLDLYNLKNLMLSLQNIGSAGEAQTPTPLSYTKFVTRQLSRIEVLVKLVGTPAELLVERFRIMWPDGTPEELQAIMSLKGLKKNEQQVIFETLGFRSVAEMESIQKNPTTSGVFKGGDLLESGRAKTVSMASKMELGMKNLQKLTKGF
mmetsp:Transcript_6722/g.8843  ORF Transcript_6722/g.8843 Transcript_6722/m.8843 type:complete len:874 (+) Transcript_6722:83-2704(+)